MAWRVFRLRTGSLLARWLCTPTSARTTHRCYAVHVPEHREDKKTRRAGDGQPKRRFWEEVRDAQRESLQASRESQEKRQRKTRRDEMMSDSVQGHASADTASRIEEFLHTTGVPEQATRSSNNSDECNGSTEGRIREITTDPNASDTRCSSDGPTLPLTVTPGMQKILSCRSAGELLLACNRALEALAADADTKQISNNLGELAIAVQMLGKHASGHQKRPLHRDRRLSSSLTTLAEHADQLQPWALVGAFRGLSGIGLLGSGVTSSAGAAAAGAAGDALMRAVSDHLPELDAAQASLVLRSLVSTPELLSSKAGGNLRDGLVAMLELRVHSLEPAMAATLVPSLVKLRANGGVQLAESVAKRVSDGAGKLQARDVAAAAAGLSALRSATPRLLEETEKVLQQQLHLCTPRSVVQFAAALSEGGAEPETFRDFLMPAARSFILDFGPRDLCTLAEAFCKAGVSDPDFLADLAHSLEPKVADMGPHEVSVAFNVFSPVSYALPNFLPAVAEHTKGLVDELSPRQLAHALRGITASGLIEDALFDSLRARASKLSHVLFGTHAVGVLLAFSEAGCLDASLLKGLSGAIVRNIDRISAQDYIAVLSTLARLPSNLQLVVPASLTEELLQALQVRGYGPWRLELEAVVHLLEALNGLRMEDEALLELICDRLPAALKRSESSLTLTVRLLDSLGELPARSRLHVSTHLHRRRKLQSALKDAISKYISAGLDLETQITLARALSRLGFQSQLTQDWLSRLVSAAEPQLDDLTVDALCDLCWSLAQSTWQIEWNRRHAHSLLKRLYGSPASAERPQPRPLLRFAWALAALSEDVPASLLAELHALLGGKMPVDWCGAGLRQLQEVALHKKLWAGAAETVLATDVQEWLELAAEVPREDLYASQQPPRAERRQKKISPSQYGYEHWLSVSLSQLRVPHQAGAVVACHRAAIVFRNQKQMIDVLSLEDLMAPCGRVTGAAELRRRQVMQLGWAVHSVEMRELYDAVRTGSLRLLVSKLLSSLDPAAARQTSFGKSALGGRKTPQVNVLISQGRQANDLDVLPELADDSDDDQDDLEGSSMRSKDPRAVLRARAAKAAAAVVANPPDRERL